MKLWFDNKTTNFSSFCSEQFLLLPLFSENVLSSCKDFQNFKEWSALISDTIILTTVEECDYILFPEKLNNKISSYISKAKQYNKKIITFYNDDNDIPSALDENVLVFRTSLNASKRKDNEFSMPAWSRDFNDYIPFKPRSKNIKPVVSFCGHLSHPLRHPCIEQLNNNNNIEKSFIIRDMFWGGRVHDENIRLEYVKNMTNSDLVLCVRGAGNFSYRFYEALSAGRVPIFVNSDSVLPCEDKINWKELCVYADKPEDINEAINIFWNNLTEDTYTKLQNTIRDIYTNFISPAGFTKYLSTIYS